MVGVGRWVVGNRGGGWRVVGGERGVGGGVWWRGVSCRWGGCCTVGWWVVVGERGGGCEDGLGCGEWCSTSVIGL